MARSNSVELHCAWVWDCDECGRENFERAVEGDSDEAAMLAHRENVRALLVAEEAGCEQQSDGDMYAPELIVVIAVTPQNVLCRHCGCTFYTTIATVK